MKPVVELQRAAAAGHLGLSAPMKFLIPAKDI
jgi:hypothetical protein